MAYDQLNLAIGYSFAVKCICLITCLFGIDIYRNTIISVLQLAVPISKFVVVILTHQVYTSKALLDFQAYKLLHPYLFRQAESFES